MLTNDTVATGGAPLNPASVAITVPAAHGTTTVNPDGTVKYTPATNYSGPDSYTYKVCDTSTPTPVCDTATVSITVPADTVTAVPDNASTPPATPVTTDVLTNDTVTPNGAPLDPASVAVTVPPTHGTTTVNPDGTITYTPAPGFGGTDSYTYQVCDKSVPTPVCGQATVTIAVTNTVGAVDDNVSTPQNTPVTTTVLANDTFAPNGSPLDPTSVTVTTPPAHGTTTVNPDGTVKYTPATNYSGPDAYTYQVCDTSSPTPVCSSAVVHITVPANTVTGNPDTATTPPGTPVTTPVLTNDTVTPGGAPLNPGSVTVTTPPTNGTTTVNPDGTILYTPTPGTSGTDTYTYNVCDTSTPTPVCSSSTVTVNVVNTVTAVDDSAGTAQNTPVITTVLANDTVATGGAPLNPASVVVTVAPLHGTTTVNADGTVKYTPAANYAGPDSYTYQVCDTSAPTPICDTATVAITIGVDVVTAVPDNASTQPATPVTTDVLANDTVTPNGAPLDPTSVTVTTPPAHGTTSVNPDGTIKYTPAPGFGGTDSYTYRVCDTSVPTPVCGSTTVTIAVTNTVGAVDDNASTPQNTPVTTNVLSNDTIAPNGSPLDPASVTVTTPPAHGTTTVNPDGTVKYTPATNYSGPDAYTYRVCDTSSPTPVCSSAVVHVTVPVNTVTGNPDAATTPPGAPVTTPVLTNDTVTPGGAPLNPGSVTIATPPTKGTTTGQSRRHRHLHPDPGNVRDGHVRLQRL